MPPKGPKVDQRNLGTTDRPPTVEVGKPRRPVKSDRRDRAPSVVGARESRVHGDRGQEVGTHSLTEKRLVDSSQQVDKAWLLVVQRKLYQWSREHPDESYRELWNWITCLLYTSPSPRDVEESRMPSSA